METTRQQRLAEAVENERRRNTRYLFSAPVLVWRIESENPSDTYAISLEFSEGGWSALLNDDLEVGEKVRVRMRLPAGPLDTTAIVRHHTGRHYGFEFDSHSAHPIDQAKQQVHAGLSNPSVFPLSTPGPCSHERLVQDTGFSSDPVSNEPPGWCRQQG